MNNIKEKRRAYSRKYYQGLKTPLVEPPGNIVTKRIPDFENYAISEDGRLWSYKSGRWLKPGLNNCGYELVGLSKNGKRKNLSIHRLVAKAFISNKDNLPEVDHIDGNKLNNNLKNLRWVTSSENKKHAWDMGLFSNKKRVG